MLVKRIVIYLTGLLTLLCCTLSVASAQNENGIISPLPTEQVRGVVVITGTAADDAFLRYELAFLSEANIDAGWVVFADGATQIFNGPLAVWDTTVGRSNDAPLFPDGVYRLRLRIVRTDNSFNEFYVGNIAVVNDQPEPTPTLSGEEAALSATQTAEALTATPTETAVPFDDVPTEAVVPTSVVEEGEGVSAETTPTPISPSDALPTLTPFPTLTPLPTISSDSTLLVGADSGDDAGGDSGGLLDQVQAVETDQFGQAFRRGALFTIGLFVIGAFYLLARDSLRWMWRQLVRNW